MPRSHVPQRWVWLIFAAVLAPLLSALRGGSSPLHTALRRSEPAIDAELAAAPTRIALWFTAKPQLPFSRIRLFGPLAEIELEPIVADTGNGFFARVSRPLRAGAYTVQWQTASADGHAIRGEFAFRIVQSAQAVTADTVGTGVRVGSVPAPLDVSDYRAARWMEFLALLTVLGTLGFRHGVLPPLAARGVPTADAAERARRLGQGALFLYGVASLVRLYTQMREMFGADAALAPDALTDTLIRTTWGIGWTAGVVGALLVLAGWSMSKRAMLVGTPLALTGALGMVVSPALSGHATTSSPFVLSLTLDMVHVAAAGLWLGGLLLVVVAGVPAMRRLSDGNTDAAVSALVNSFHPLALFCAPLVVVSGLGTSWLRLGGLPALGTPYGRALLIKIALVLFVIAVATYNSLRARRRLGTPDATRRFRASAMIELVFAAIVVFATTALVATPLPVETAVE